MVFGFMRNKQANSGKARPVTSDYLTRLGGGVRHGLRALYAAALRAKSCLWDYKCLVIMNTDAMRAADTDGLDIVEYREYSPSIVKTVVALGRQYPNLEKRLHSRFRQGMRYYEVYKQGVVVATAWIHPSGYRFVDEIGYLLPIRPTSVWLRDIFIVNEFRGQGLFARLVAMMITQYYPDVTMLWSDTETNNTASVSAHRKCNFEIVGYMRVLRIFNYFLLRDAPLPSLGTVSGYRIHNRYCIYGSGYRDYCRDRMA